MVLLHGQPPAGKAGEREGCFVLQRRKQHLNERLARAVALGVQFVDQAFERNLLVFERGKEGLTAAVEELAEGGVAGERMAQHQGIDEKADLALRGGLVAARHRGADGDVAAAAKTAEGRHKSGFEDLEQGGARLLAHKTLERRHQFGRQRQLEVFPLLGENGGPLPVGRQLERFDPVQFAAPEFELTFEGGTLQQHIEPGGIVAINNRQLGQLGRIFVELRKLAGDHLERPAVGRDVVEVQQENVTIRREADQATAENRPGDEVERTANVLGQQAGQLR